MKKALLLLSFAFGLATLAQTRMAPHVTRANGGFDTTVILLNTANEPLEYTLQPYSATGVNLPPLHDSLDPATKIELDAFLLFSNNSVSHFTIEAPERIQVSVAYQAVRENASPAHVTASEQQDFDWIIFPGNWATTWDGFALVNMGDLATSVTVSSVSPVGGVEAAVVIEEALAPFAKTLYVLSSDFPPLNDGYFLITADEPVSIIALRGSLDSTLLWQNGTFPGPRSRGKCKLKVTDSGADARLLDVIWDGSLFVAVGGETFLTSPDGIRWTESRITLDDGATPFMLGVAAGDSGYVAVGAQGRILTSPDGAVWEPRPSGTGIALNDVIWNGSEYLLVGQGGTLMSSSDGVAWDRRSSGTQEFLFGIDFTESLMVAVGDRGTMIVSEDGLLWEEVESGTDSLLRAVTHNEAQFVAVGDEGRIITSPDGRVWMTRESGSNEVLRGVVWDGNRFLAVGDQGAILISNDGINWSYAGLCTLQTLCGAVWNGSTLVVIGDHGAILTETNQ